MLGAPVPLIQPSLKVNIIITKVMTEGSFCKVTDIWIKMCCVYFVSGEKFAMMSGTSMAAPHVAGVAALIKQTYPNFSPSAIASALSTTALLNDNKGGPIMAQRTYANPDQSLINATPFDMGSGFVNATAALDPGLIFDTSKFIFKNWITQLNFFFYQFIKMYYL